MCTGYKSREDLVQSETKAACLEEEWTLCQLPPPNLLFSYVPQVVPCRLCPECLVDIVTDNNAFHGEFITHSLPLARCQ